ncbi:hypothetical protein [Oceanospirillum sediminis]|uniref:Uncharacterized protein n=1 Tax=Oceanospirillum sediminis TaxID=2760088 RepID=A0A839IND3_9GAMM|nr:hypothetical protein [Oceanospirillum sediminis]MBB1486735.1 hypothetical protein [Oceanospirillum sediminis]
MMEVIVVLAFILIIGLGLKQRFSNKSKRQSGRIGKRKPRFRNVENNSDNDGFGGGSDNDGGGDGGGD